MNNSLLERLPKLGNLKNSLPTGLTECSVCGRNLKNSKEFNKSVKVCGECLSHHGKVEAALNSHAEAKSIQIKKQIFEEKLKARLQGGIK